MINNRLHRWMLTAGLFTAPFYILLIITLGELEPGFSHLTTAMSLLGGAPDLRGQAFNFGVAITGMLVIVFGIGLRQQLPSKITAKIGCVLLIIGGMGLIGAGYFHCNEGCKNILAEPNAVGQLHIAMSLIAGIGTGLAPLFVWLAVRGSEKWKGLAKPTLMAAILANLPGITFWFTIFTGFRLHSVEGLIQRLGFVVVLIWIFLVAVQMWRTRDKEIVRKYL